METDVENRGPSENLHAGGGGRDLELSLLGGLSVRRDGELVALPRSRKCRALIAYLAATGSRHRREHLCELLWEVPDDPKGELRWTLSKIRRVLGDAIVADREAVAFHGEDASIDSVRLRHAAERLHQLVTDDLEKIALHCDRSFGEGLDLPRCPEFQSWLLAAREDVRQAQLAVLNELLARLRDDPQRALPFGRMRVACDPLDEQARLDLLATLAAAGRADEAERQREVAVTVFKDAGIPISAKLSRPLGMAPPPREAAQPMVQRIQFCTPPDGTRIAYSTMGSGPPLVKTANWMTHLEYEMESPLLRHWLAELSRARTLTRYDARGNGLSDRDVEDLSLDAFVRDLETVASTVEEEKFDLLGISQGCAVAIAYAVKHPERVRKLVLFGGFATGWRHNQSPEVLDRWNAMVTLAGFGWGRNNPAFRQMFTSLFAPRATPEQADWFNELQRVSASPESAQRLLEAIGDFDVAPLLPAVQAPTIVFHSRDDALVAFGAGRHLATRIPNAQFVSLDSANHLPLENEAAWQVFVEHLRAFLSR